MKRRQVLATLAGALPAVAFARAGEPSAKKGWAGGDARLHKLFGAHWYYTWSPKTRPSKATEFEDFVEDLARSHRLPIWITEFNGWSGPEDEHYDFVKDSLRFLERSRDVERYAYFEPGKGKPHSLLKNDGSLSRIGEPYRDAGS
jgi:hypothetical protein